MGHFISSQNVFIQEIDFIAFLIWFRKHCILSKSLLMSIILQSESLCLSMFSIIFHFILWIDFVLFVCFSFYFYF